MMISWFYILSFYFFTLVLFFNYSNPLIFWVMMELNLLSFCLIMLLDKGGYIKQDSLNYLVYYFLIQSSASILFLFNFSFQDWGSIFNMEDMFFISLVLKIGLFPLFFWVFNISMSLNFMSLFFLLTFQKIPLFSALFSYSSSFIFFLLLVSFMVGSVLLLFSTNFLSMLISSSISYVFMLYLFYSYSIILFIFFFSIYSFFLGLVLFSYFSENKFIGSKFLFFMFSFFLGIPPLGLFFFKFMFTSELSSLLGWVEMVFFWFFSLLSLVGYMKFFYSSFFLSLLLYYKNEFCFKIMTLFSFVFYFFFLLLI